MQLIIIGLMKYNKIDSIVSSVSIWMTQNIRRL